MYVQGADGKQIRLRKGERCDCQQALGQSSHRLKSEQREPIKLLMDCPFVESDIQSRIFNRVKMDLVAAEFYANWWLVVVI